MNSLPVHQLREILVQAGIRPTRQRIAIGWLLFGNGHQHITAEMLYQAAVKNEAPVSRATVYNTLHQLTKAGMLREIAVDGSRVVFDSNTSPHGHFLIPETNELVDIPEGSISVENLPVALEGTEIVRIDLLVRLRKVSVPAG